MLFVVNTYLEGSFQVIFFRETLQLEIQGAGLALSRGFGNVQGSEPHYHGDISGLFPIFFMYTP